MKPGACREIEARHGFAGAPRACGGSRRATASPGRDERLGGLGGHFGAPHLSRSLSEYRGVPRLRRGAPSVWGVEARHGFAGARRAVGGSGGPFRGPASLAEPVGVSRGATASPGRPERVGGRGAPRLRRGATSGWGVWGAISGPRISRGACRSIEGCHGFAGAPRACGGSRRATASPGRDERLGGLGGHFGAPHLSRSLSEYRGVPRLRRGAPSVWGVEARHGFAGARRAVGGSGGPFRG